jgi:tRNA 2-thiouridine synthesizing protein C
MPSITPRRILIQCRCAPYGSSRARDAVEVAMACGAFDQTVSLLFLGHGVLALSKDQQPVAGSARNLAKLLGALPDYGIDTVCVERDALANHGLTEQNLCLPVKLTSTEDMATLYASHDVILTV